MFFSPFLHKIYDISHSPDVFAEINPSLHLTDILPEQGHWLGWLFLPHSTINSDTAWEANDIRKVIGILSEIPLPDAVLKSYIFSFHHRSPLQTLIIQNALLLEQFR